MTIASGQLILIDTNVLVNLIRNNEIGQRIENTYGLSKRAERPLYSSITEGEVFGLAKHWGWSHKKLSRLRDLLNQLVRVDAGLPDVVSCYSDLYVEAIRTGSPKGENDLWIAASAKAAGAVLITCDNHFNWMHPRLLPVEYVPVDR